MAETVGMTEFEWVYYNRTFFIKLLLSKLDIIKLAQTTII